MIRLGLVITSSAHSDDIRASFMADRWTLARALQTWATSSDSSPCLWGGRGDHTQKVSDRIGKEANVSIANTSNECTDTATGPHAIHFALSQYCHST